MSGKTRTTVIYEVSRINKAFFVIIHILSGAQGLGKAQPLQIAQRPVSRDDARPTPPQRVRPHRSQQQHDHVVTPKRRRRGSSAGVRRRRGACVRRRRRLKPQRRPCLVQHHGCRAPGAAAPAPTLEGWRVPVGATSRSLRPAVRRGLRHADWLRFAAVCSAPPGPRPRLRKPARHAR